LAERAPSAAWRVPATGGPNPLAQHLAYLEAEFAAALAAPLSVRKARLSIMLADAYADRLFATGNTGAEDILAWRETLGSACPALATIFALAAGRGPTLVIETVPVPLEAYDTLSISDFMVSLYNDHTVQRIHIALPNAGRLFAHDTLAEAIAFLRERS
jgi:hypothetical protein